MRPYMLLTRSFFAQLFASESATSEMQYRQALIGVFAFLILPGLFLPLQMNAAFDFAVIRYADRPPGFPGLLDPLIRLFATIFIAYSIVTIGFISAFAWDALGFDRRDAMVLGPLPLRGRVVVGAKLTALAALLLGTAFSISLMTAVPFAMIASNYSGTAAVARHALAHLIATMSAATCVFCGLVTIRAALGLIGQERKAIASLLQFGVVGALLSFIVLLPYALRVVPGRRRGAAVYMMTLPSWNPTDVFLGLYETARGSPAAGFRADAAVAGIATIAAIAAAVISTVLGYRVQMQRALTPAAAPGRESSARLQRLLARAIAGPHQIARAMADFIVTTIARNRPQQVPVVMNGAIGLAIAVAGLSRAAGTRPSGNGLRTAVLWIPLLGAYWTAIGLRASYFVPSELPSAWTFRANGPDNPRARWSATRAASIAVLIPPALFLVALLMPLTGWRIAAAHAAVAGAVAVLLGEWIALTIDFIPFTRAYQSGHAKLKSRWPLYMLGMWIVAFLPARFELRSAGAPLPLLTLAAFVLAVAAVFEVCGRWRTGEDATDGWDELTDDGDNVTVLGIATAERSVVGA